MASSVVLFHKIQHIRVDSDLKEVLWAIVEEIEHSREQAVTKTDFSELKEIVRDLAQSQKELAGAQQRTEQRVEELVQAQQRTEQRVEELRLGPAAHGAAHGRINSGAERDSARGGSRRAYG